MVVAVSPIISNAGVTVDDQRPDAQLFQSHSGSQPSLARAFIWGCVSTESLRCDPKQAYQQ